MVIPGNPILLSNKSNKPSRKDVLHNPFSFLASEQAVFNSARDALYNGIKLLDYVPLRVHIPAYCCQSVLVPFGKLGIEIKFYDIDSNLRPVIKKSDFSRGDVFLLVHFFGIPQDTLSINQLCQEFNMVLVEDCAHTLPDPEARYPVGSIGAFSVYSLRKQLPVPDGGVLVVNNPQIKKHMINNIRLPNLYRMSLRRWLITNFDRVTFILRCHNVLFLKSILRRVFGLTNGLLDGNVSDAPAYDISYITVRVLERLDIKSVIRIRRNNYHYLVNRLANISGLSIPFPSLHDGAVPQVLPLLLSKAEHVKTYMNKKGVFVGRWPGLELPRQVSRSDFPMTFTWVDSCISLPVHQDLKAAHLDIIIKTLKQAIES
ncbi:hypothetical protein C4544_02575 [candidate division WS5 bacterium]|uniref:DegT/DnrJ/EryC1/StrS aminotransferase family protein n=1 Tax=candidate division WS5 bacterium TaxID=2093353 RepID=A0A419DEE3_9BACT|nr:MAG: hypothetical protein C4544_02575 [candidate division WS5 bacterium]